MEELILFCMSYIVVFIVYQIFIVVPAKKRKNKKGKKGNKEALEVKYLETLYKIDMNKINYNQLLQICALVSSFDISLTVTLVCMVNGLLLELLVGFISIALLILISYHIVYLFYKKKNMIRNVCK